MARKCAQSSAMESPNASSRWIHLELPPSSTITTKATSISWSRAPSAVWRTRSMAMPYEPLRHGDGAVARSGCLPRRSSAKVARSLTSRSRERIAPTAVSSVTPKRSRQQVRASTSGRKTRRSMPLGLPPTLPIPQVRCLAGSQVQPSLPALPLESVTVSVLRSGSTIRSATAPPHLADSVLPSDHSAAPAQSRQAIDPPHLGVWNCMLLPRSPILHCRRCRESCSLFPHRSE